MKKILGLFASFIFACALPCMAATGQTSSGVQQNGVVTAGHGAAWVAKDLLGDAGFAYAPFPPAGIANSSGAAWSTPYTVSGGGTVLAATNSPTFTGTVTLPLGQAVNGVVLTTGGNVGLYLNANGAYSAVTFSQLSGVAGIPQGGTGQTTQAAAITALTGTQSAGTYLRSNGTSAALSSIQAADVPTLNQNTTGNAATATALQTPRTIGGVSFNGTANITVASATGGFVVSGGDLSLGVNNLALTGSIGATGARVTKGWFTDLQVTNAIAGSVTGNAGTATALQTARTIGGVSFDGTANITVASATGGFAVSGGDLSLGVNNLGMTGSIGSTGSRVAKVWAVDMQVTNAIAGSVTGNAGTATALQTARNFSIAGTTGLTAGAVSFNGTADVALSLSGTLAIGNGGTGQTTQQAAINALTGVQTAGSYLRSNGTNATLSAIQAADVPTLNQNTTGNAATATALQTARNFAIGGTTGLTAGNVSFNGTADTSLTLAGTLAIANGGTGQATRQAAINALTGTQAAATYLRSDGTNSTLSAIQAADVPTLNQNTTGNAGTATALQTARTIGGVSFNGTANITVASATGGFAVSGGDLALSTNNLTMTGSIGATGARVTKGWFTDLQVTNTIVGNAATATTAGTLTGALSANQLLGSLTAVAPTGQNVPSCSTSSSALQWVSGTGFTCNTAIVATTNANLTGPITSVGNATSIASQTGTGTTFAMSASPTFTGTLNSQSAVLSSGMLIGPGSNLPNRFQVNDNSVSVVSPTIVGSGISYYGANASNAIIQTVAYGGGPLFLGYRRNGTVASPTTVVNNDEIVGLRGGGYDANSEGSTASAYKSLACSTWSSTDHCANWTWETTQSGTVSRTEKMRLSSSGNLGIGTTVPAGIIDAYGAIYTSGRKQLETAQVALSADGTYQIASGSSIDGTYEFVWSGSNREERHTIKITANAFDTPAIVEIISSFSYTNQIVLSNFRVVGDAGGTQRYFVVDVANRNGSTGNLNVTSWGQIPAFNVSATPGGSTVIANVVYNYGNRSGFVGIGTATPAAALDVVGGIATTTGIAAGGNVQAGTTGASQCLRTNSNACPYPLSINQNANSTAVTGTGASGVVASFHGADGVNAQVQASSYNNEAQMTVHRAQGTQASRTTLTSGLPIGRYSFSGFDGTNGGVNGAAMFGYAASNWTTSDHAAGVYWEVTPVGSINRIEAMRIISSGNVGIGTNSPNSKLVVYNPSGTAADVVSTIQNANSGNGAFLKVASASLFNRIDIQGTGQTFTIGQDGSSTFRISDSTTGTVPFKIIPGAANDTLDIGSTGVCINCVTATTALTVTGNANTTGNMTVGGTLIQSANLKVKQRAVTTGTSDVATANDNVVLWASATAGAKAQSIVACNSTNDSMEMTIKDYQKTAATGNITITPISGTIDGAASFAITANNGSITIECYGAGTNWYLK